MRERGANERAPEGTPSRISLGYHHPMQWLRETAQALIALHLWKEQKRFEDAIRDAVRAAAERARREGYEQALADGTRRAVN